MAANERDRQVLCRAVARWLPASVDRTIRWPSWLATVCRFPWSRSRHVSLLVCASFCVRWPGRCVAVAIASFLGAFVVEGCRALCVVGVGWHNLPSGV